MPYPSVTTLPNRTALGLVVRKRTTLQAPLRPKMHKMMKVAVAGAVPLLTNVIQRTTLRGRIEIQYTRGYLLQKRKSMFRCFCLVEKWKGK